MKGKVGQWTLKLLKWQKAAEIAKGAKSHAESGQPQSMKGPELVKIKKKKKKFKKQGDDE